jgi:hypothetical protein
MKVEKATLYAELKPILGGYDGDVGAKRIAGLDLIIDEWEKNWDSVGIDQMAYVLATVIWETARTMQPIKEMGGLKYLQSKKYWPFYGRGFVQLTWKENYIFAGQKLGINLVDNPDDAMKPEIAVKILFHGMEEGWFSKKKLDDYIDDIDEGADDQVEYVASRRIINGKDKAAAIADIAMKVRDALKKAKIVNDKPLSKSRTVGGAGTAAIGGASILVSAVNDVVTNVAAQRDAFSSGNVGQIIVGIVVVLGAVYALYARWDDAGRPRIF